MSSQSGPPALTSLNHIKLPSANILRTHDFYVSILGFTPLPHFNHYTPSHELFAVLCRHPSTGTLVEIRYAPEQSTAQHGWDPLTWGVGARTDLESWAGWLDEKGVRHSSVFTAIKSWVMCAEDPDGRIVRFYVEDEEHEWTDDPDVSAEWLGTSRGDPNAVGSA